MQKYNDKTLEKKEKSILNKHKLIKFDDKIKINKLTDIFQYLFVTPTDTYTLFNDLHCEYWRGRSYIDSFLLAKNYFPEITFKEVYNTLYELVEKQNPKHKNTKICYPDSKPWFFTCPNIGKARFYGTLKL